VIAGLAPYGYIVAMQAALQALGKLPETLPWVPNQRRRKSIRYKWHPSAHFLASIAASGSPCPLSIDPVEKGLVDIDES
jgi:hypothetical protein